MPRITRKEVFNVPVDGFPCHAFAERDPSVEHVNKKVLSVALNTNLLS